VKAKLKQQWLRTLETQLRASPHTIEAYSRDLDLLLLPNLSIEEALSERNLRKQVAELSAQGRSPRSISRAMSALNNFTRWAIAQGHLDSNFPIAKIRTPKADKPLPKVLDPEAVAELMINSDSNDDKTLRDKAMLELLYSSGLRVGELQHVCAADLQLDAAIIRVHGKGSKQREVPLGRHAIEALQRWISRVDLAAEHPIFVNIKTRKPLTTRGIQYIVNQRGKALGLQHSLHPHLFRHAFASHILESSGDLRGVQELLGHENLSTTQIYTHVNFQHLSEVYEKAHPRAKKK